MVTDGRNSGAGATTKARRPPAVGTGRSTDPDLSVFWGVRGGNRIPLALKRRFIWPARPKTCALDPPPRLRGFNWYTGASRAAVPPPAEIRTGYLYGCPVT